MLWDCFGLHSNNIADSGTWIIKLKNMGHKLRSEKKKLAKLSYLNVSKWLHW